jgi:sulfate transport system ATP-binding protein
MALIVRDLCKAFGATPALRGVTLDVADGEFLALLGPSGSGKSTLLRLLAGLDAPTSGSVELDGADLLAIPARRRRAGMVFQNYALFRHMTVAENIAFGMKVRPRAERPAAADIERRTHELLRLVQLDGMGARHPSQLSGGQQQRVALARALAIEPRLLLLDEPFGALDAKVRRELRQWLRRLHDETGVTTIFVTHDQDEALEVADTVAILNAGRIEQSGAPEAVSNAPASAFVFDFLSLANRAEGEVANGRLALFGADFPAPAGAPEGPVVVFFRPHEIEVAAHGFEAVVEAVKQRGPVVRASCRRVDGEVAVEWAAAEAPAGLERGATVRLAPRRFAIFPR